MLFLYDWVTPLNWRRHWNMSRPALQPPLHKLSKSNTSWLQWESDQKMVERHWKTQKEKREHPLFQSPIHTYFYTLAFMWWLLCYYFYKYIIFTHCSSPLISCCHFIVFYFDVHVCFSLAALWQLTVSCLPETKLMIY